VAGEGRIFPTSEANLDVMPTADVLRRPGACDHLVQAYLDDWHLAKVVAEYIGNGLARQEAAAIIATPSHVRLFVQRLDAVGGGVAAAIDRRQLLILDAQETLANFMVDGWPDRDRFRCVVAAALEHVRAASPRGVRLYGEMVELLWRDSLDATMELERMWSEVLKAEGGAVSLLCGYRLDGFERGMRGVLRSITRCHSHLLAAEDQPRLEQAVNRAYAEVFGSGDDVDALRRLMITSADLSIVMPEAQAALLALDTMPPIIANDVRARAHRHYSGA
jgi:hypothetical protein